MPAMKKLLSLGLFILFLVGCVPNKPTSNNGILASATQTPFAPGAVSMTMTPQFSQPEKVVQAFLTDVQEAPAQVNSYLSESMQNRFPGSEVIQTLGLPGDINGFGIRSVEVNTKNPLAFVTVGLDSQGEIIGLRFTLIMEHAQWVIDAIDKVPLS